MKPDNEDSQNLFQRLRAFFDPGSLKIRLWGYFGLFAVILVVMLWILQVVFVNFYYEGIKLRETQRIVTNIEGQFQRDEPISSIRSYVTTIYRQSGIYIHIESVDGTPLVIPLVNLSSVPPQTDAAGNPVEELPGDRPGLYYPTIYRGEIDNLKSLLLESEEVSFSRQTLEPDTERKTLEYAVFLETPAETEAPDRLILYAFSPLYPQESTSQIFMDQLRYVTIIAVLLSIVLGFYLSRIITRPLEEITERAEELAAGNYGIEFPVAHYTEIMRLADTLSTTSSELAETRTMQRDIIANVSHDLKTPLTMIRSYAEMIADLSGDNPEKRTAHLEVIMEETDRLGVMIAELLDISKLQSGQISVKRSEFSLSELIRSTITAYSAFVEQEGYELSFTGRGEGLVNADEMRIKQVLDNLVSNALKYSGKNKRVEISMTEKDGYLRVEVTDHGVGINRRDLRHIWDRYYQSSTHHSRSDSTGLGLSIVKEILELHDAKFGADSVVRKGSTFWFEIPKAGIEKSGEKT